MGPLGRDSWAPAGTVGRWGPIPRPGLHDMNTFDRAGSRAVSFRRSVPDIDLIEG